MLKIRDIGALIMISIMSACTVTYERINEVEEQDYFSDHCSDTLFFSSDSKCSINKSNIDMTRVPSNVNAAGIKICPNNRCPDVQRLPPQPCAQPMPQYYGNVSQETLADGIVLIHPYTRAQVVCFDRPEGYAIKCAQDFHEKGYVLITDIPQLPAKYDFLRDGTYPTRRWRNGGEVVPRW